MWDLIVSVPDHCLSFYFKGLYMYKYSTSDNVWLGQHISLRLGTGPRLQYFQLDRNSSYNS